jgi:hypothetical protein
MSADVVRELRWGTGLSLSMALTDNLRHDGIMTVDGCVRMAVEDAGLLRSYSFASRVLTFRVTFWAPGALDAPRDGLLSTKPTCLMSLLPHSRSFDVVGLAVT